MGNLKIISLYSGSTGNATLVSGPGGDILIDAGKSVEEVFGQVLKVLKERNIIR